jgi:hypothetical protein
MNNIKYVPSTLNVVAKGVDISKDLEANQEQSVASLLQNAYEEKENTEDTQEESK